MCATSVGRSGRDWEPETTPPSPTAPLQLSARLLPQPAAAMLRLLVVAASGGLGTAVVREALSRNHSVSVLVRSQDKLAAALGNDASLLTKLAAIHVGSGDDPEAVAHALRGCTDVISAAPPNVGVAKTLGTAAKAAGARLVWTAGASVCTHLRMCVLCPCAAPCVI